MKKRVLNITLVSLLVSSLIAITVPVAKGQKLPVKIPREQSFVWGMGIESQFNTMNPLSYLVGGSYWTVGIYEALAWVDPINGKFVPCLAENWSWVGDHTFEINIQPKAHFRKGQPVTAEDVVFSMKMLADPKYSGRSTVIFEEVVDSLEVIDEKTLHVHVKKDLPAKYGKIASLMLQPNSFVFEKKKWTKLLDEYGEGILEFTNMDLEKINASGPYTLVSNTPELSVLGRVENYWGNQIGRYYAVKYYKLPWYGSDEITIRNFTKGESDFCGLTGLTKEWLEKYKEPEGLLHVWSPDGPPTEWLGGIAPQDFQLILNPEKEIFRHRWMRHAIAYALNYDKLVEVGGAAEIGWPSPPYFLNTTLPWDEYYNSDLVEKYYETETTAGITHIKYDPDKAIEILKEHAEGSVDEGWTYKGKKIGPFKALGYLGAPDIMGCSKVIAKSLSDIGIPTQGDFVDYGFWDEKVRNWDFDIRWGLTNIPPFPKPIATTYDEHFLQPAQPWSGSKMNYWKYWTEDYPETENSAEEVREIIAELWVTEAGTEKSFELARKLQEIVIPQLPLIPIYQKGNSLVLSTNTWVNYSYKDDQLNYGANVPGFNEGFLWHVYPKCVDTVSFTLSSGEVEVGEPVIAKVTLRNNGDYDHLYPVYIHRGPAKSGLRPEDILAHTGPIVPTGGTKTVELEITFDEPGSYTLTVDDWRFSKWDPGDPIEKTLIVTKP